MGAAIPVMIDCSANGKGRSRSLRGGQGNPEGLEGQICKRRKEWHLHLEQTGRQRRCKLISSSPQRFPFLTLMSTFLLSTHKYPLSCNLLPSGTCCPRGVGRGDAPHGSWWANAQKTNPAGCSGAGSKHRGSWGESVWASYPLRTWGGQCAKRKNTRSLASASRAGRQGEGTQLCEGKAATSVSSNGWRVVVSPFPCSFSVHDFANPLLYGDEKAGRYGRMHTLLSTLSPRVLHAKKKLLLYIPNLSAAQLAQSKQTEFREVTLHQHISNLAIHIHFIQCLLRLIYQWPPSLQEPPAPVVLGSCRSPPNAPLLKLILPPWMKGSQWSHFYQYTLGEMSSVSTELFHFYSTALRWESSPSALLLACPSTCCILNLIRFKISANKIKRHWSETGRAATCQSQSKTSLTATSRFCFASRNLGICWTWDVYLEDVNVEKRMGQEWPCH